MKKRTIAISACLLGEKCRYDATDNLNAELIEKLDGATLIPFCPEDDAFGTPRPTIDLIQSEKENRVVSNASGNDVSQPIIAYANRFFNTHKNIDLVIGKDRSPSCGVCSAKLYDTKKNLLSTREAGLMIQEAKKRDIPCIDAEDFKG